MKMAESKAEMQINIWKVFDDYFTMHAEKISSEGVTESDFFNVTQSLKNTSFDIYEQNENTSLNSEYFNMSSTDGTLSHGNLKSVYLSYPPEILMFGAISSLFLAIFGTFGNLISILALVNCKRLRNATTAFIVNLCVSDMLYCAVTLPLTGLTFIHRDWRYGDTYCKLNGLLIYSNGMLSVFTVVAITINRYVLICHPRKYKAVYSRVNTGISIACLWLFPFTLIALPLLNIWGTLSYKPEMGKCGINDLNGTSPKQLVYLVTVFLPSVMFIACYLRIYFVVKNSIGSNKRKQELLECKRTSTVMWHIDSAQKDVNPVRARVELRDKKEFRLLRIMLVIFIVYTVTIVPLGLIKFFNKEAALPVLNVFSVVFYFASSAVNPVLYIVMSREYRKAYKELFTPKTCCN